MDEERNGTTNLDDFDGNPSPLTFPSSESFAWGALRASKREKALF